MYVQLRENLRVTHLVWLFLFINVYWWSNSLPTNTSTKSLVSPVWSNLETITYSSALSCIIFFFVVLSHRFTNLQKIISNNPKRLFFIANIIGLGVMFISSNCGFDLGFVFGFSILMYNLYIKFGHFYFDSFWFDLKERLGVVSESFIKILLVVMIYVAFSFNYLYATVSLTLMLILRHFKDSQTNPLKKYLETFQHNSIVREYHRPREFPLLYHISNMGMLTLVISLFYPIVVKLLFNKTLIMGFFLKSCFCLFVFITCLNLFYNLYIVWFANFASKAAVSESVFLTAKVAAGVAALEAVLEELEILETTSMTKVPRKAMGAQVFESNSQKEYYRTLQAHLPIGERDKCLTTMGVYGSPDSPNYLLAKGKVIEKSWEGRPEHLPSLLGNFPSFDSGEGPADSKLLTYYDLYNPHLARVLADEHRKFIEKTADRAHMELLYPEIVEQPYSKHLIEHEHDVQIRPAGFPKKKG